MKKGVRYRFPLVLLLITLGLSTGLNGYLLTQAPDVEAAERPLSAADSVAAELARARRQLLECKGEALPDSVLESL